jgi:hypothetical protein
MMFDDEKYKSLRNILKSSARVKAKGDFEKRLFERIREAEKAGFKSDAFNNQPQVVNLAKPKSGFIETLAGLFRPAFVPALGLTFVLLIAIVVYFGYFNKMGDSDSNQVASDYRIPEDLIIYVKGDVDSFSSNYPKEYSAVTDGETEDLRTSSPTDIPSDYFAPTELSRPGDERLIGKDPVKLDKVSEEQKFEMQKEFKDGRDGIETKGDRKVDDGIIRKEGKMEPKKKTEGKLSDEKKNIFINEDEDDGSIKQQISPPPPNTEAEEKVKDTGDKDKEKSRISRAIKDSSKTKIDSDDQNETIQQK